MKILFVCGAGRVFGREMVTLSLMKGLRERGHEVSCVTSRWSNGEFERRIAALSIPFVALPLGFISKTLSLSALGMTFEQVRKLPSLWVGYKRIKESLKPDVVVHSAFHHTLLLMPLLRNSIDVFHVHDAFAPTRFYRAIFKAFNKRIDAFVGVSRFVANTLRSLELPPAKVHFVLNGITRAQSEDCSKNGNNGISEETSAVSNLPLRIGIVGQVAEWKGHEDLVDALHILDKRGEKFVCKIYGDGNEEFTSRLKCQIVNYGLADKVKWMGFVDDRAKIYCNIDVCVTPSRFQEPFGMVAAEAAIFGLPVIATRLGGLPEIVLDQRTGYLIDVNSPEQIAEKFSVLAGSRKTLVEMGRTAVHHTEGTLSEEKMVEGMESLFQEFIEECHW
jgi:glycosyltransferase involved in cell wall biosynthesis